MKLNGQLSTRSWIKKLPTPPPDGDEYSTPSIDWRPPYLYPEESGAPMLLSNSCSDWCPLIVGLVAPSKWAVPSEGHHASPGGRCESPRGANLARLERCNVPMQDSKQAHSDSCTSFLLGGFLYGGQKATNCGRNHPQQKGFTSGVSSATYYNLLAATVTFQVV